MSALELGLPGIAPEPGDHITGVDVGADERGELLTAYLLPQYLPPDRLRSSRR